MVKLNAGSVFLAVLASSGVWAAPSLEKRQSITPLSSAQIATFKPYSFFAAAAYCNPSTTRNWTCGTNCNANADFIPVASGGDGSSVQFWYVGYSPSLATVIVAHQGTDTSKIEADATDANIIRRSLNSSLFPGVSSSISVHDGFGDEQEKTATQVLAAVNSAISAHGAKKVTIVGHSLGAAISLLDSVYLPLHISGVTFQSFLYGMPRVGNQDFADYVDAHLHQTRITNKKDLVPIVPGRFLGYHHPSGEVHIEQDGSWDSCPGKSFSHNTTFLAAASEIFQQAKITQVINASSVLYQTSLMARPVIMLDHMTGSIWDAERLD
ncbi:hypothetical protein NP233_g3844 [Leucocoprinus birnbaumii]|uniref:Fungal lipase-type domain-containing protein n=1 Tax=Leucocoprinus birnbaumii TaxID=56174 RepID=A0AAD5VWA6_9AGAR|nr:hypothetical protein NP233_g3844 [Leucocoprinus birnbaumii]